jgi:SAM-dependent methyltransferase
MRSPYEDAVLYDWEYRRRRDDVRFYRTLADERGGPVLDLACGTGRLMAPLLRDGHTVVGVDVAPAMLSRAAARIARLPAPARRRALLVRADMRALAFPPRFAFAVAAFHSIQHLYTDADLARLFAGAARALMPGGWLAFDTFAPDAQFLARAAPRPRARQRRWGTTRFKHPATGRLIAYSESYRLAGRILHMTLHYQPVDARGRRLGRERRVLLSHRQIAPREIEDLLTAAGLKLIASWGGFDGGPIQPATEQHIFLAQKTDGKATPAARDWSQGASRRTDGDREKSGGSSKKR